MVTSTVEPATERTDIEVLGYKLSECLHAGSHFSTYRGLRPSDDSAVIVKVAAANTRPQVIARLEREYELTRRLDDPGVVRALALEETAQEHLLVFPDSHSVSLSQYLDGRALPLESFFVIALQLTEILGRIHMRDVVHKDVKPPNVVIDPNTLSLQLTDFGIAAALARETASHSAPAELEGTLAYIAPEQTGRMNRSVDGRSDLYSLGVTFYEMLTHRLPFETEDPAELVHQHIARVPDSPQALDPAIPEPLSQLVMKLMAKDPEDRYQSAFGLAHDLRRMQQWLQQGRTLADIPIGQHDVSARLLLPERLYGREEPLRGLLAAVEQAASGRARLLPVTGPSGIGKSSLVREVVRPIAGRQGHFVSGKFDQLNRNTPYSAIVQAFEDVARKLLSGNRERVALWREAILEALGDNAQVILDVIPAFEQLLGKQPPVTPLGPSESQFRFNLMFRRFLRALATSKHPLVIFLDDLQWADGASLALIEVLLTDADISNLLLIGAYRDDEVHSGHPLLIMFSELRRSAKLMQGIKLEPLGNEYVGDLVADTLRVSGTQAQPLADLVTAKTSGNPFFVRQFLKALHERGLLTFDPVEATWRWDVEKIGQEQITDNVVDLIAARIQGLTPDAQRLVQLAASIGNRLDLKTLSIVFGKSARETANSLEAALRQEIIAPVGEAYKYVHLLEPAALDSVAYRFPHDRLQQAAYSTIAEAERQELHDRIGRLILEQSDDRQIEERLFEIVNHLNRAIGRSDATERKVELSQLNLRAGHKAIDSTAYDAALDYLSVGVDLIGEMGWRQQPELTFELNLQRAEACYLLGRFEQAETLAEELYQHADSSLQQVRVLNLLVLKHTTALEYGEAIDDAVRALALLGEKIPRSPSQLQLMLELAQTKLAIGRRTTADLKALPRMNNRDKLAAMRVLMLATPPAYFEDPNLMPYLALRMVRLSIKYGNADHSAYGYIAYGLVLCGVLNDMPRGLAFGKLALDLIETFNAQDIKGKVIMVFGGFILHWNGKLTDTLPLYLQGAAASLEAGDLEFHGYNRYAHASYCFSSGMPLERVAELLEEHITAVRTHKHEKTDRIMRMVREAVRDLRGAAAGPRPEDEAAFDQEADLALWAERDRQALAYYYKYLIIKQFMAHDFAGCLESARFITRNFHAVMGMVYVVWYRTFETLALTALAPGMSRWQRFRALWRVRANQRRLRKWSRYAPENYLHKQFLVTAELERVRGRHMQAEQAYEEAIRLAHRHGALHDKALAHELAGEFQLGRGQDTAGCAHLQASRDEFQRWGALAWVKHLEQRHPKIFGERHHSAGTDGALTAMDSGESLGLVDAATITKAARAISEKMLPEDVLHEVMKATVMNAGATRGLLLLMREGELLIQAEATGEEGSTKLHSMPFVGSDKAPASVINYAAHAQQSVVLDDAPHDASFADDPYISSHKPLSVLCMPLVDKGELVGLLYLENELAQRAFTPARIQTLEVLAAQAAISLENARLYGQISEHAEALELKVKERTRELEDAYGMLHEVFGKYVPKRVAEAVVANAGSLKPTQTTATMLYSDIEGFTGIVEHMPPDQVMQMLNEYFPAVIEPIDRNGGIVNQFQGDAMLVTFNIPIADPRHAEKAVKTAAEIQQAVSGRTFAGASLRTRIGINTGEIIAGNIGSGERLNYTVHGDAVNLSARIEQLNKEYGTSVLVSGTTVSQLQHEYPLRMVGEVTVRGKTEAVKLYELKV